VSEETSVVEYDPCVENETGVPGLYRIDIPAEMMGGTGVQHFQVDRLTGDTVDE